MNENEITLDLRKPKKKDLRFRDVEHNGFFIDKKGRLCQRWRGYNSYNVIAGGECDRASGADPDQRIDRLVSIKFLL